MNMDEMHKMIFEGAIAALKTGEEVSPMAFTYSTKTKQTNIAALALVFHDKNVAAQVLRSFAKAAQATMVGMVNEGWTSKAHNEGAPRPESDLIADMPDAAEILIITIETEKFTSMWIYPIHTDDANQRVLDVEELKYINGEEEGSGAFSRFSVFGHTIPMDDPNDGQVS